MSNSVLHRYGRLLISTLLVVAGCNASSESPLPLAGSVEIDGRPISQGSVTFLSSTGDVATGQISNGQYAIPSAQGLPAGTYGVQIYGQEPTGKTQPDPDVRGQTIEVMRSVVPAQYNERSELTVEITAQSASQLDFKLQSKNE